MQQSLALKYRPLVFENIVGQEVNNRFLATLIKKGQIGKNVILYGPWGSGKTSLNRIYARALNCLNPTESGSPCNECYNCNLFFKKQYTDYIEMDGATQGSKDKVKDLVKIAKTPPFFEKYRVMCIDECHNLSKQAWDALLKLIEEPPSYLVFILTTTEFVKVPETIQSRCHPLEVKLLNSDIAKQHLKRVCEWETLIYEEKALDILTYIAKGHLRDLIKNLEHVCYFGDITFNNTLIAFNIDYFKCLIKVFEGLFLKENLEIVLNYIKEWHNQPQNIFNVLRSFLITIYCKKCMRIESYTDTILSSISREDIENIYNKICILAKEYNIKVECVFDGLFLRFDRNKIFSFIELYSFIITLYNFIHTYKCGIEEQKKIFSRSKSQIKNTSKKEGRQFIKEYKKEEIKENSEKIYVDEIVGKIYPHFLLSRGFSFKQKTEINIMWV